MRSKLRNAYAIAALASVAAVALVFAASAAAATVLVTPATGSWTQDDTRCGGAVSWTNAYGAPPGLGTSSLKLSTTNSNADKAGLYTHTMAGMPLSAVTSLSYWTYQDQALFADGAVSFQLQILADGTPATFTTMVYEPYNQPFSIVNAAWQQWDVGAGTFWSSRTRTDGLNCNLVAGFGGPPFYSLAQLQTDCPNAVVVGIGVNVGSFNPGWTVATDGVEFNGTIYNFELAQCTPGYYSASGVEPCTAADPGNYVDSAGATGQTPAPAGSFATGPGATSSTLCPAGTFSSVPGASSCTPAPAGSFATGPGATTSTLCPAGTFSSASGASSCTPAPAGSFATGPGATVATACAVGTYQPVAGASSCLPAAVGYYVDITGAIAQTPCPTGTTTGGPGSTSVAACNGNASKLGVLALLNSALLAATNKHDVQKLKEAYKNLNESLNPSLWIDGNHLQPKGGEKVFQNEKECVRKLTELIKDKNSGIDDAVLLGWIQTLVAVDRSLAMTAYNESLGTTGADAKRLDEANKELAKGDADAAAGKYAEAIEHYKNAWKKAQEAVKKL